MNPRNVFEEGRQLFCRSFKVFVLGGERARGNRDEPAYGDLKIVGEERCQSELVVFIHARLRLPTSSSKVT